MSDIKKWSTAAASNNASPPDGWPEGQAPSTVNNCARENMAATKRWYIDAQWTDFDHTPTFLTTGSFSLAGDLTTTYHSGRRLKIVDASTLYGTITSASFSTVTRVSVSLDSGELSVAISTVAPSILTNDNQSTPRDIDGKVFVNGSLSACVVNSSVITDCSMSGGTVNSSVLADCSISGGTVNSSTLKFCDVITATATPATSTVYSQSLVNAWVIFRGTDGAIQGSYNVDSVARSATGHYTITWGGNFPDANHVVVATPGPTNRSTPLFAFTSESFASTCQITVHNALDGVLYKSVDANRVHVMAIGTP
jgi:hypothetical protein